MSASESNSLRSPKRYGLILDGDRMEWSLPDHVPPLTSLPSVTTGVSNESARSGLSQRSGLFPGFHYATADASVDPIKFHSVASQILGGQSPGQPDARAASRSSNRSDGSHGKHTRNAISVDRHACSCGKLFSTHFRLREHQDHCQQHHAQTFAGENVAELSRSRPSLDNILTSIGLRRTDSKVTSSPTQRSNGKAKSAHSIDRAKHQRSPSLAQDYERDDAMEVVDFVEQLLDPAHQGSTTKACHFCGEVYGLGYDDLARHLKKHYLDLSTTPYSCDICQIAFANELDLHRHLRSAKLFRHCGFTFEHSMDTCCSGHHPPPAPHHSTSPPNTSHNHHLMRLHLRSLEASTQHKHRADISQFLISQLTATSPASERFSVHDRSEVYSPSSHMVNHRDSVNSVASSISPSPTPRQTHSRLSTERRQHQLHHAVAQLFPEEEEENVLVRSATQDQPVRATQHSASAKMVKHKRTRTVAYIPFLSRRNET